MDIMQQFDQYVQNDIYELVHKMRFQRTLIDINNLGYYFDTLITTRSLPKRFHIKNALLKKMIILDLYKRGKKINTKVIYNRGIVNELKDYIYEYI